MKYLLLILWLIFSSCTNEEEILIGDCPNPPRLSKEKLSFNAEGGIDSVIVDNSFWWFEQGSIFDCELDGEWNDSDYCNYNYCHDGGMGIMKAECSWFSVTRTSDYKLLVSVNPNETGEKREQGIGLQAGNCFFGFLITQSAE